MRQCLEFWVIWKWNVKGRLRRSMTKSPMCLMCVSWAREVLILVIIVSIGSVSNFMKLGGQTLRTSIRKVLLETTLCVFGMFRRVLHVCLKWNWCERSQNCIWTYSGWKRLGESPQGQPKGPWGRTFITSQDCPIQSQMTEAVNASLTIRCPVDGSRWLWLRHERSPWKRWDSVQNHGPIGQVVGWETGRLDSSVRAVNFAASLLIQEVKSKFHPK